MNHSEHQVNRSGREGEPLPDWIYKAKAPSVCPKCGKAALDTRVHRPAMVKLLFFWLPLKRFECSFCFKRSYVR